MHSAGWLSVGVEEYRLSVRILLADILHLKVIIIMEVGLNLYSTTDRKN